MDIRYFKDAINYQPEATDQYDLPNKIRCLTESLINTINYGKLPSKTQQMIYNEYGLPNINIQVVPCVHTTMRRKLDTVFKDIYHDINIFNVRYFATVLKCAEYKQLVKPEHYPLMMSDLSIRDIESKSNLVVDLKSFGYDISTLNLYIAFDHGTPVYSYSYEVVVTDYRYLDSIEPYQSIKIDSNVNYTLFPDVYLHYTRY